MAGPPLPAVSPGESAAVAKRKRPVELGARRVPACIEVDAVVFAPPVEFRRVLSADKVAAVLECSVSTVERLCAADKLGHMNIGGKPPRGGKGKAGLRVFEDSLRAACAGWTVRALGAGTLPRPANPVEFRRVLTPERVAGVLGCCLSTVYRLAAARAFEHMHVGGQPAVKRSGKNMLRVFEDSLHERVLAWSASPGGPRQWAEHGAPTTRRRTARPSGRLPGLVT